MKAFVIVKHTNDAHHDVKDVIGPFATMAGAEWSKISLQEHDTRAAFLYTVRSLTDPKEA